jgi:four helix bundle protein
MTPQELKQRTRAFALRCIKLAASFPRNKVGDVVGRQLIKAATSVAANYHSACAARSFADFLNKLGIVEEEADESVFWIDFAPDAGLTKRGLVADLLKEGQEILRIVVASEKTAKARKKTSKKQPSPSTM